MSNNFMNRVDNWKLLFTFMATCLSYIGYAAGGLLVVTYTKSITGVPGMDLIETASSNYKMQFMLVLFFINKPLGILWIVRKWQTNQMTLGIIFLLFWFTDAVGLWSYQMIVFGPPSIPTILFLGFFSALVITTSIQRNYRKFG